MKNYLMHNKFQRPNGKKIKAKNHKDKKDELDNDELSNAHNFQRPNVK
jgi:hypothetical protein